MGFKSCEDFNQNLHLLIAARINSTMFKHPVRHLREIFFKKAFNGFDLITGFAENSMLEV